MSNSSNKKLNESQKPKCTFSANSAKNNKNNKKNPDFVPPPTKKADK